MSPRLEDEAETGLECQEITINSQNDCPFTEHELCAQAQAGGEAGGAWRRGKGEPRGQHHGQQLRQAWVGKAPWTMGGSWSSQNPALYLCQLRPREGKGLAQGHTVVSYSHS